MVVATGPVVGRGVECMRHRFWYGRLLRPGHGMAQEVHAASPVGVVEGMRYVGLGSVRLPLRDARMPGPHAWTSVGLGGACSWASTLMCFGRPYMNKLAF